MADSLYGKLCLAAQNAILGHITGTPYTPAPDLYLALSRAFSLPAAVYQWTESPANPSAWFLEASGGGAPVGIAEDPDIIIENGAASVKAASAAALAAGEWAWDNIDGLAGDRVYVRLTDDADPGTKADGFILIGGNPGPDGAGLDEPAAVAGYAARSISFSAPVFRRINQDAQIDFDRAMADWGHITHWAVKDGPAGDVLAAGPFTGSIPALADSVITLSAGAVYIRIAATDTGGGLTDYCAHAVLDLVFRNGSWAAPQTFAALLAADADDAAEDDTDLTEITGTGYARVRVYPAGGSSPAWAAPAAGSVSNAAAIDFSTPGDDDWDQVTAAALIDGAGKVLCYDNDISAAPDTTGAVRFLTGQFELITTNAGGIEVFTFLDLIDTPASYVGMGGRFLRVKADGTGVDFINMADYQASFAVYDGTGGGNYSWPSNTNFRATAKHFDTHDAYDLPNRQYVIPRAGLWLFTWGCYSEDSATAGSKRVRIEHHREGVLLRFMTTGTYGSGKTLVASLQCEIGDVINLNTTAYTAGYWASIGHNLFSGTLLHPVF